MLIFIRVFSSQLRQIKFNDVHSYPATLKDL